jgi:hypothetical protein
MLKEECRYCGRFHLRSNKDAKKGKVCGKPFHDNGHEKSFLLFQSKVLTDAE